MSVEKVDVLLVGNFLSAVGGSRGVCEELAIRLPAAGCNVFTTSSKKAQLPRLIDMLSTVWRQRHRYAVAHVDVFSGPAFFWAEAVCAALSFIGKPYILTLHGGSLPGFARRRPGRVRRLLRSAAVVTTPSRYLLESLAGYREDLRFIPNGLDVNAYSLRRTTASGPRLLWLRAFHRVYNPALAVRMMPLVLLKHPGAHLTMIGHDKGDGSLQEAEHLAARLKVARCIDFCGAVPKRDVPKILSGANIFLNTTNVDNAPVSIVEAMACGLCVVTTNVGGIPYLVDDEQDGLLVPQDNPQTMAAAVLRILDDAELADRLSRNGRQKAEQFDWSPIIREWRSLLAATAASGRFAVTGSNPAAIR